MRCRGRGISTGSVVSSRKGVIAIGESLIVIAIILMLLVVLSQWNDTRDSKSEGTSTTAHSVSENPVLRIDWIEGSDRIWVHRRPGEIFVMSTSSSSIEEMHTTCDLQVHTAGFSHDGKTALLAGMNGALMLSSRHYGTFSKNFHVGDGPPLDVVVSRNGHTALSAMANGHIFGWIRRASSESEYSPHSLPIKGSLSRIALNDDGDKLFVAYKNGNCEIVDPLTGTILPPKLPRMSHECTNAVWSANGTTIVIANLASEIIALNAATGSITWKASPNEHKLFSRILSLAISHDANWIAASGLSTDIQLWNLQSHTPIRQLSGHSGLIRSIAFAADGNSVLSGGFDGNIREWTLGSKTESRRID